MHLVRKLLQRPYWAAALWIFVLFSLTSGVWLSWEYHLLDLIDPRTSDLMTMGLGYLCQALGLLFSAHLLKKNEQRRHLFLQTLGLFLIASIPSLLGAPALAVLLFGFVMNFLCGQLAAHYLYEAAHSSPQTRRGLVFGAGYALSTVFIYVLSLPASGTFLHRRPVLIVYFLLALSALPLGLPLLSVPVPSREGLHRNRKDLLVPAALCVFLLSLVKNMGFSFPSGDIGRVSIELSRLFYAAGLLLAGLVSDRSRKTGAILTVAALAIPFVQWSLSQEPVPALLLWGLNYLFYGFFSVFRVLLFMDLAEEQDCWHLAPLGLFAGRLGDAAGTFLCILLADARPVLIVLTLCLFAASVFLFFRLFQMLYMPEAVREKSEQEVFEGFAMQHDLSAREKDVLRLLLLERTNTEIAQALFVSESTIKYHVHNLLQKTGARTRQDLVRRYNTLRYPDLAREHAG